MTPEPMSGITEKGCEERITLAEGEAAPDTTRPGEWRATSLAIPPPPPAGIETWPAPPPADDLPLPAMKAAPFRGFGAGATLRSAPLTPVPARVEVTGPTLADHTVMLLERLGVETAFGLVGGAIAPICDSMARSKIRVLHTRHEAGAAFAAIESYYASGRPSVVFTTTGPGITNAITGVAAARRDGAKLILISGTTAAPHRGRWAFQETSGHTLPMGALFGAGPFFNYGVVVEQPVEVLEAFRRIAVGLQQPHGFVAHVSIPFSIQTARDFEPFSVGPISMAPPGATGDLVTTCARLLEKEPFAIWVGFGARRAAGQIRELARRTGAAVMCSPRGKGIFPEDHPQFVGVTGFGGHASVHEYMVRQRPAHILVLGTRLGEFTSFWDQNLGPRESFIHVDIDPEVPGVAYPDSSTIGVHAEVGRFVNDLLGELREGPAEDNRPSGVRSRPPAAQGRRTGGLVRPGVLMDAIQRVIIDGSDAPIITEAGNAFAWGTHALVFREPGRYRVSTGFGSMGHAVTGVLGAALARRDKAVALAGDGAMLMNSEVSTAVQYRIPAVWIVLNDSSYGMIHQGMGALGMVQVETAIPPTDFVKIADGMGARGIRVEREVDLEAALRLAMEAKGPFVVDVMIDPTVLAPTAKRFDSLNKQSMGPEGGEQ